MNQCNPDEQEWIKELTNKYFIKPKIFNWLEKNMDKYVMYTPEVIRVTQMINLLTACYQEYSDDRQEVVGRDTFEKIWVYCYAWAIAGLFEAEDRLKFHTEVLEKMLKAPLPQIAAGNAQKPNSERESVFDFSIDPETKTWASWQPDEWSPPRKIVFSQLLIPTSDSTRAEYIIKKISSLKDIRSEKRKENGMLNTLLVGSVGTAKTSTILMYANKFDPTKMGMKRINFSYYTLPHNFQEAIDGEVEKKNAKLYRPPGDKSLTIFLDDVSMPQINEWGDQITLEITRQLIDNRQFTFLEKEMRGFFKPI